ncbi:MAG: COX15/CtaA family protein [Planctomycetota bacterium]
MTESSDTSAIDTQGDRRSWPSRFAVLLVCLTWPMIWVGGLVTTYDAGMSVPDWPGTYGYNLLLYPMSTWLLGPFDLFIEHGHRLLGATLGLVAIGFLVTACYSESRTWVKWFAVAVLLAVIGQGVLGGLRVTQSARTLAMIHGCTATAFFGLCVVAALVTGRNWTVTSVLGAAFGTPRVGERSRRHAGYRSFPVGQTDRLVSQRNSVAKQLGPSTAWPLVMMAMAYMQLVLGAQLRHVSPMAGPTGFAHIASTHVTLAFVLWFITAIAYWRIRRFGDQTLSRPSGWLIVLCGLQISLGIGTWLVNYGYPRLLQSMPGSAGYLLRAKDYVDAGIVTSHVAVGSLIFAVAVWLWVRTARRRYVLGRKEIETVHQPVVAISQPRKSSITLEPIAEPVA